jgi:hypothetical protein
MGIIQTFRYAAGAMLEAGTLVEILAKWGHRTIRFMSCIHKTGT